MATSFERRDLELEIVRLGCDFNAVGACSCIVIVDAPDAPDGIELADDYNSTFELDVAQTLARLRQLPNNAGLDEFWHNTVDSDWSKILQRNSFIG